MKLETGIHHFFEFLSLLAVIVFYRQLRNSYMQWFLPFLATILFLELLSNSLYLTFHVSTLWLSEICQLISIGFYSYILMQMPVGFARRKAFLICSGIYIVLSVLSWIFWGLSQTVFTTSIVSGGFLMIVFTGLVFITCLQKDDLLLTPEITSCLWIAAGILVFYSGIEVVITSISYLRQHPFLLFGKPLYNTLPRLLSVIMYSCFSISFYTWRTRNK